MQGWGEGALPWQGGGGQKQLTFSGVKVASDVELGGLFWGGLVTNMAGTFVWTPYYKRLSHDLTTSLRLDHTPIILKSPLSCTKA
jgi:hypothetical protein